MAGLPLIKRTITGGMVVMIKYQNFTLDEQMNTFAEFWLGAHLAFILPAVRRRCIPGDHHDDGRDDYHDQTMMMIMMMLVMIIMTMIMV